MKEFIAEALSSIGEKSEIINIHPVSGGSINQAFYVKTKSREYFIKMNQNVNKDFFQKEADGLRLLKEADSISIPEVYGERYLENSQMTVLVMEWVEGNTGQDTDEQLGRGIAKLHQMISEKFGLEEDNYIGLLPQVNGWMDDWVTFYRERRLWTQLEIGQQRGTIGTDRRKKLIKLMDHLPQWIGHAVKPSLLHGDLWRGNWIVGQNGKPYLVDPAVFFGDRELELAFTELFGGFSERFYRAYEEINPISLGYQERKPLYQLYYLLVHLNVFGESYGQSVDQILDYYV